jgi:hypothetical protein
MEEFSTEGTIKRLDREPTDDVLIDLMAADSIKRNADLKAMLSIMNSIDGGYSFFLDGKWGDGKTFFVKQMIILLEHLNLNLTDRNKNVANLFSDGQPFHDVNLGTSFFPVYYNAWDNDSDVDPIISLIGTLISEYEIPEFEAKEADISKRVASVLDAVLKPVNLNFAKDLVEGFKAVNLIEPYKANRSIRKKLLELLDMIIFDRADKVVLFIDELDRCSPSFALRLLERVKYLLTQDNSIIVFSTDMAQLVHTVEGYYGTGFDGGRYLSRFFDNKVGLTAVSPKWYLEQSGMPATSVHLNQIIHEMVGKLGYSMRDINRYVESIAPLCTKAPQTGKSRLLSFVDACLIPVILAINIIDPSLYRRIVDGTGFDELREFVADCPAFNHLLEKYFKSCTQEQASKDQFLEAVYKAAFIQGASLEYLSDFTDSASSIKDHIKFYLTSQCLS